MSQKIYYVHDASTDKLLGYVVASDDATATKNAVATTGLPPEQIRVADTGKTKPRCCPRK